MQRFNKYEVLEKIKNEYDKYGVEFLTAKNVMELLNCGSNLTAIKYIRLFCKEYNIGCPISNEHALNLIEQEYNKNGIDALNSKNVMKLLNCGDATARKYIRKFCKEYNIDCPIKSYNKDEVLQQIKNEYDKYGVEFLTTKNVMELLNCSDLTALRYIRKFCKEYNIDCPIKTKTHQTFNKDEVLQQIKNEYDKYGVEFLTTKNVKKLLNCSDLTALRYIRKFCKEYNIARLEKNKKSASQNLEILE